MARPLLPRGRRIAIADLICTNASCPRSRILGQSWSRFRRPRCGDLATRLGERHRAARSIANHTPSPAGRITSSRSRTGPPVGAGHSGSPSICRPDEAWGSPVPPVLPQPRWPDCRANSSRKPLETGPTVLCRNSKDTATTLRRRYSAGSTSWPVNITTALPIGCRELAALGAGR